MTTTPHPDQPAPFTDAETAAATTAEEYERIAAENAYLKQRVVILRANYDRVVADNAALTAKRQPQDRRSPARSTAKKAASAKSAAAGGE